ncbi:MAG: Na+/H+ antiporter NhaA [Pseudomonadota bacterium]
MLEPLRDFLRHEAAAGRILMLAVVVALLAANSPFHTQWVALWEYVPFESTLLPNTLKAWVKDGLMAIFFFVVGLEMKRELISGHLRDRQVAKLPLIAAVGGMVVPALVYLGITYRADHAVHMGWAIPCATDIALALGVLALLGNRVPVALKVLLLALAIFDDLGAMVIIAFFYSGGMEPLALLVAIGAWATFAGVVHVRRFQKGWPTLLPLALALLMWLALLPSGLHPSIGAVALAAVVPTKRMLPKLEHALHPYVAFGILPLFALSAAGVNIGSVVAMLGGGAVLGPSPMLVFSGVGLGLLVGKPVGIALSVWLAERSGIAKRPEGVSWKHIWGMGAIAGVGFTMSLFVGKLAFEGAHPELLAAAKAGVMVGSLVAASLGVMLLARIGRVR